MDNMMFPIRSSSVISTFPTATPMQRTFLSWNLMVDLTSVILALRSSLWETGVGNLPAMYVVSMRYDRCIDKTMVTTLGKTGTQETRNLLDESIGSDEGIILGGELLDELLVLVELLQVIRGHGIDTKVLGTIDIVLVTENAVNPYVSRLFVVSFFASNSVVPDGHVGARDTGELDGSRETLVTLRVIVLETDLELDGLEEVSLLGVGGVLKELLHVGAHSGDCDLGHLSDSLPIN